MTTRTLICFPSNDSPGLRAEAAHYALGLAACGGEVIALGSLGGWRHSLRLAKITATDFALPGDERKLTRLVQEYDPQIIHAFGADMAQQALPLTQLIGAGGVVTLGHQDLPRLNPHQFRTASAVFVPCEYLREQVVRRLPAVPVAPTGYLLSPPVALSDAKKRFLAEELGLADGAPMVLLADRFHGSETDVALTLLEAAPLLAERIPGIQIVLAGTGLRLGELEQLAIEVNNRLGYRAVLLPGYRDDIHRLLTLTTVAVGSGRFAMEAVGAGVALVAAGAAGMVGAFTNKAASVARFTCCGRHGHLEPLTAKSLASEIIGLFAYPQYREQFAVEGQELAQGAYERSAHAGEIAAYYARTNPAGAAAHTPQHITAVMPDTLRDMLFALPAVAELRANFPLAQVRLIAKREHQRLLRQLNIAERALAKPTQLLDWPSFVLAQCRPRAEVCLSFSSDLSSLLFTACSLAPHRLGFTGAFAEMVLTDHQASHTPVSPERALELARVLGVSTEATVQPPTLPGDAVDAALAALADAGIGRTDPFILLCPQAAPAQAWESGYWDTLLQLLGDDRPERIAVLDSGDTHLPAGATPVHAPEDGLVLAALLARAALVIAADSGPLHLADLLGVTTIGLYGPTSPDVCALPNEHRHPLCHPEFSCHPCAGAACQERRCLRALTPEEVAAQVAVLLPALTLA